MSERRHSRKYLIAEVKLRTLDNGKLMDAMAINISAGGIGIYTLEALKPRQKVAVKMTVLVKQTVIVSEEIPGTIRWVRSFEKNHAAGIEFSRKIDKKNYPILSKCLEQSRSQSLTRIK